MPVWAIGVIFSLDTITYTLTSFVLNFIPEHSKNFKNMVMYGTFFFVASMLLSGPAPFLFKDSVTVICFGILLGGIGGALVNNNCVPALTHILATQIDNLDMNQIKNNVSAINTGAFGLGSILGPILASVLESSLGYRWAFTSIGIMVVGIALT